MNGSFAMRCDAHRHVDRAFPLRPACRVGALVVALIVLVAGCRQDESLPTDYGQRRGSAAASVNGTSVFAEMFREAGPRVVTVTQLSAGLDKYDVVVWVPDDFGMPSTDVQEFLERWLAEASGRTLVFVGRDYDAACDYWQAMVPEAPAEERVEVMRRAAEARAAHSQARIDGPQEKSCEWFVMRRDYPGRHVQTLGGVWGEGVDGSRARIWSQGRLDIPTEKELMEFWGDERPLNDREPQYSPLLTSGQETLAFEVTKSAWDTSRILVVANGSFLLNLPLVNPQHRQLAGKLIDECLPASAVAFLESRAGGPPVHGDIDPVDEDAVRWRVLLVAHWVLLGAIYCFFVFPIFGRPKSIQTDDVADFGQHVDAMASLLERSGDVAYAQRQLALYRHGQHSGVSSGPTVPQASEDATRNQPQIQQQSK